MKILINACLHVGGGVQVADAFIRTLKPYKGNEYVIIISNEVKQSLGDISVYPKNFTFIHIPYQSPDLGRFLFGRYKTFDDIAEKYKPEIVFSVFGPSYWKPKNIPHICGFAISHYVYRDSPFFTVISKINYLKFLIRSKIKIHCFKRDAQIYITENTDVSKRLQKLFPDHKIYTITNYYNPCFDDESLQESFPIPKFDGITLLTVAANYPHKNYQIIPKVIEYFDKFYPKFKYRFVVSLNAGVLPINEHILPIGKVKIAHCPSLFKQSDFLFMPTLLESFSASYAEAMKMQKPILTSNLPFAVGLCGKAAVYFEPLSAKDIAEKIYKLAQDSAKQQELIDEGVMQLKTFDTYIMRTEKYLQIMKETINSTTDEGNKKC